MCIQSSSSKPLDQPMALANLLTHLPWWSQIRPPPPASPGHPITEPSIFNIYQSKESCTTLEVFF